MGASRRAIEFLERHSRAVVFAAVLVASGRIVSTYTVFNHTADEPAHVACGMEWLDRGTYQYETQHPPLARVAAAVGPYLLGIRSQGTKKEDELSMTMEGLAVLYREQHYDLTLAMARLGILPFFWIACLVVYWWGRRYQGKAAAAVAVLLFSFLPPVLAHAGLATTDMALTAFLGGAFLCGMVWLERPTAVRGALFGASVALAVLAKFSTLVFFPASAAVALVWYLARERPSPRRLASEAGKRLPSLALAVLTACLVIWAGYRFSYGRVDFADIRLPAPELYSGIHMVTQHNAEGHPAYLLGRNSRTGWWYYYPVVLAVKTPLAFLFLLGFGLVLAVRKGVRAWLPVAFSAGILLVGLFSHINIGVRHILPIYIGFSLTAALAVVRMGELAAARKWIGWALALLLVWLGLTSLAIHPDYIAYFNELAGSQPEKILVDSDLDWGQDMKRLGRRLQQVGAPYVTFTPFVLADLTREHGYPPVRVSEFGIPSPGWNAVSLTQWKARRLRLFDTHPEVTPWPELVKPGERIGRGMMLWYFPPGSIRGR